MADERRARSWREALAVYARWPVVAMLPLGFAAGLPFLLVFSTLAAWLEEGGVEVASIGFFSWVGLTYSVKVVWAPVVDRLPLPLLGGWLGQRRSWMLLGQLGVTAGLVGMAGLTPQGTLLGLAVLAVAVAFSSATQDVALDAFRIESAPQEHQGALSAAYMFGYRSALLVAGAGALYIADAAGWRIAYLSMGGLMAVGMLAVLCVPEPGGRIDPATRRRERALERRLGLAPGGHWVRLRRWLVDAVVAPFADFFARNGHRTALIVLALVGLYKLSDIAIGIMANPFYLQLGFSKSEIASIGKLYGFFMTIAGTFLGGLFVARFGVLRPLLAGAVLVAVTNLLFAHLAQVGPDLKQLALVISADNLGAGFSNAAFIAWLSGLTNRAYTATQYALFSSLMTLPGKMLSGFSGVVVAAVDYPVFFIYTTLLGLPAMALCLYLMYRESLTGEPGGSPSADGRS